MGNTLNKTKLTRTSKLGRKLNIVISQERVEEQFDAEIKRLCTKVKLQGFRKGKVPADIVRQRYGEQVRMDAINDLMRESVMQAMEEHEVEPAHTPSVDAVEDYKGGVRFNILFEVMPDAQFDNFRKLKLVRYQPKINDVDIQAALQRLRESNPDWKDVDGPSELGHRLTCDFTGLHQGEAFPGGDAKDYQFILGKGEAVPGFEENLIGLSNGEEVSFTCVIPDTHGREELRGQEVEFNAKIHKVERSVELESESDLAKAITPEGEDAYTSEVLREKLHEHLEQTLTDILSERTRKEMLEKLAEHAKFPVPEALIADRLQRLGLTGAEGEEKSKAESKSDRERVVNELRSALVLSDVADRNQIKADRNGLHDEIAKRARQMGVDEQKMQEYYFADQKALSSLESNVREARTIEQVLDLSEAKVCEMGFEEATAASEGES